MEPIKIHRSIIQNSAGESMAVAVIGGEGDKAALKRLLTNENNSINLAFTSAANIPAWSYETNVNRQWWKGLSPGLIGFEGMKINPKPWLKDSYVDTITNFVPIFEYDGTDFVSTNKNLEDKSVWENYGKYDITVKSSDETINNISLPNEMLTSKGRDIFNKPLNLSLAGWKSHVGMTASERKSLTIKEGISETASIFGAGELGMGVPYGTPSAASLSTIGPTTIHPDRVLDPFGKYEVAKASTERFGSDEEYKALQKENFIEYLSSSNNALGGAMNFNTVDLDISYDEKGTITAINLMSRDTGKQVSSIDPDKLAQILADVNLMTMKDLQLKGMSINEAKDGGLDSDNWNVAGSEVFDENGARWGETFKSTDGTIRALSDQERDASKAAALSGVSKTSTYPTGKYGTQAYSESTLGGQQIPMGAAGMDPNLTTMDPYRYLPTADYAGALPSQLPGAQLPAISELYQQNIPAFQEAYNVAQLLGMVAADPDAAKGQTGTIGFQKFLQTNPDIKSIYSQGLNAIEGVKDQVRAGRMPETLSATDRMIYDKYIAGSPGKPLSGHQQELWLRMELSDYLPEAMRYSAKSSLQRRYDAAVTGDPNALATTNIYGTSGNPWAGGTTTAMPTFGGDLSFGAGTPMGQGQTKTIAPPANTVGPTDFSTFVPEGATGTRMNPNTGMMEIYDLNTGKIIQTYYIESQTDPYWTGAGIQAGKTVKHQYPAPPPKTTSLAPFSGIIPEGAASATGGPPMVPTWDLYNKKTAAILKKEAEEELRKVQEFEMPFFT